MVVGYTWHYYYCYRAFNPGKSVMLYESDLFIGKRQVKKSTIRREGYKPPHAGAERPQWVMVRDISTPHQNSCNKKCKKGHNNKREGCRPPLTWIISIQKDSDIHEKATHDERRCDHLRHHSSAKPRDLRHWHPLLPWQIPKYQVGANSTHLFSLFSIVSANSEIRHQIFMASLQPKHTKWLDKA